MRQIQMVCGAFLVLLGLAMAAQKKITSLNVLMPLIQEPLDFRIVQYQIEAYGGCYTWVSSQPSVLKVVNLPDEQQRECSARALVQLATTTPYPAIVWITVRDKYTFEIMKVEARVARLHRIEIATKLKTIDVGALEELYVRGFDEENNTFSSLEGVRFEWTIQEAGVLDFVSLRETVIKSSELRKELEGPDFMTDIVVARGLRIGKATVIARVREQGYAPLEQRVVISVIEQFAMIPHHPLFLLPRQSVQFELYLIKNDAKDLQKIPSGSKQYFWETPSIHSKVLQSGLLNCGNSSESSKIIVKHLETSENQIENHYTVVPPHRVELLIREVNETNEGWERELKYQYFEGSARPSDENLKALVVGRRYLARIDLYDAQRHAIFLNEHIVFDTTLNATLIRTVSTRHYEFLIEPLKVVAETTIVVRLKSVNKIEWSASTIETRRSFQLVTAVQIVRPSEHFLLPYIPTNPQKLRVLQVGGSGLFEWSVEDERVAVVSQEGTLVAQATGRTTLIVRDQKNPNNFDNVTVVIVSVTVLESVEAHKELVLGIPGWVYIKGEQHFTNCSNLQFKLESDSVYVEQAAQELDLHRSVAALSIKNQFFRQLLPKPAFSLLRYQSQIDHQTATQAQLETMVNEYLNYGVCGAVALRPLRRGQTTLRVRETHTKQVSRDFALHVNALLSQVGPSVLAFGSSARWALDGGPQVWEDTAAPLGEVAVFEFGKLVTDTPVKHTLVGDATYEALCTVPGELKTRQLSNHVNMVNRASLLLPDPQAASTTFEIECSLPVKLEIITATYWLMSPGRHHLHVNAYNAHSKEFQNFSSLNIQWSTSEPLTGVRLLEGGSATKRIIDVDLNVNGSILVKAATTSIGNRIITAVSDEARFFLQQNVRITPNVLVVFRHVDNHQYLQLTLGSGEFRVTANDTNKQVIEHTYDDKTRQIKVSPLQLGCVELHVHDLRLSHSQPAHAKVIVTVPASIRISANDRLILIGTQTHISVEVFDSQGLTFTGQYGLMNLELLVEEGGAYRPARSLTVERVHPHQFRVIGRAAGDLRLVVALESQLNSNTLELEVFQPLRVGLATITLAPECYTTVQLIDGPSVIEKNVLEYNADIIDLKELSPRMYKITALKQGQSKVQFTIKGGNKTLTEASLQARVAEVTSVTINTLKTVHVEATFRITTQLFIGTDPLTTGVCPYVYKWTNKQPVILRIHTLGLASSLHALNATALGEGQSQIDVEVQTKRSVRATATIKCIQRLGVDLPTYIDAPTLLNNILLVPPNTEYRLNANSKQPLKYSIVCDSTAMSIDSHGLLRTGSLRGKVSTILIESATQEPTYLVVQVTTIAQVLVRESNAVSSLQSEATVQLEVLFLDQYGRQFAPLVEDQLVIRVLNDRVLEATYRDAYLHIRTHQPGESLVVVHLKAQPDIYDLFNVQVGSLINPPSPVFVHQGGYIEFSTSTDTRGHWSSDNAAVVSINSQTGRATAEGVGDTVVNYHEKLKHSARVKVFKAVKIAQVNAQRSLTNIHKHPSYRDTYDLDFIVLSQESEIPFDSDGPVSNNLQLHCESNNPTVFKIKSLVVALNGRQIGRCQVTLQPTKDTPRELQLTALLSSKSGKFTYSEKFTYPVLWGLRVDAADKFVQLSPGRTSHDVRVHTTQRLDVQIDDSIRPYVRTSFDDATATFTIHFSAAPNPAQGRVQLIDPATNIMDFIDYAYITEEEAYFDTSSLQPVDIFITGAVIVITLILLYNYMRAEQPKPARWQN